MLESAAFAMPRIRPSMDATAPVLIQRMACFSGEVVGRLEIRRMNSWRSITEKATKAPRIATTISQGYVCAGTLATFDAANTKDI